MIPFIRPLTWKMLIIMNYQGIDVIVLDVFFPYIFFILIFNENFDWIFCSIHAYLHQFQTLNDNHNSALVVVWSYHLTVSSRLGFHLSMVYNWKMGVCIHLITLSINLN